MAEQEQEDRIGQCFVDAKDPTKWYGPVTRGIDGTHYCERGWNGQAWILANSGDYLRIPPRPDLPTGLRTRECRLPKKGERFVDIDGDVFCATEDWVAIPASVYYGRRWIVADEPEAEKPHGPTCVELTTAFRDIQRLLTEYLVPDGCNAHDTISKILAISDTKPFSQLRRETHDETRI